MAETRLIRLKIAWRLSNIETMKRDRIKTTIEFDRWTRDWSLLIIDEGKPGTHETYNVVFNSGCVGLSYKKKGIAKAEAQRIINEYKNESHT